MNVLDRFRLDGKRLFVTGGSRGFGRVIALAAAEAGADIVLNGRDPEALAETAGEVRERGRAAWSFPGDIAQPALCEDLCKRVLAEAGPIDILVNNVGGRNLDVAIEDTDLATWQKFVDLNLTHCFICTKMIGGAMLARGAGRIINIASISGMIANRGIGGRHYETTKAALIHFTRILAMDHAVDNIRANTISPGFILTERSSRRVGGKDKARVINGPRHLLNRPGEPEEIAAGAVYLASDDASFVTATDLLIDGGYIAFKGKVGPEGRPVFS